MSQSTGRRILVGRDAVTSPSSGSFGLDLSHLRPGTYRLAIFRSPKSYRSPTVHTLQIKAIIDTESLTSQPAVVESRSSTTKIRELTFSVGPTQHPVRYYAEGKASELGRVFDWSLSIEPTKTLPILVLHPIRRFTNNVVRSVRHPIAHGMRPAIGSIGAAGAGTGALVRRTVSQARPNPRRHSTALVVSNAAPRVSANSLVPVTRTRSRTNSMRSQRSFSGGSALVRTPSRRSLVAQQPTLVRTPSRRSLVSREPTLVRTPSRRSITAAPPGPGRMSRRMTFGGLVPRRRSTGVY